MIRNAFSILAGFALCITAPMLAGLLMASARSVDVVIVLAIAAACMSGAGMMWIYQDGKSAAQRRHWRSLE